MSVIPVNLARVSQNLRAFNTLTAVTGRQLELFRAQNQVTTGLAFQAPSEDPDAAVATSLFDQQLDRISVVKKNLDTANAVLATTETAMDDAIQLMREAKTIAIEAVSDTIGEEERASLAQVITEMIDQAIAIGNRAYLDNYLFSGHDTAQTPFAWDLGGVQFSGDSGRRETIVDTDFSQDTFTISGMEFFGAVSTPIRGQVDLNPAVTGDTRVKDLRTPAGDAPDLGKIVVSNGANQATIDLSSADTLGDIVDKLNAEMPAGLQAQLQGSAINIAGGQNLRVLEAAGGDTARSLGLLAQNPVNQVLGVDLDPVLTGRTQLANLNGGAGLQLAHGITIRNGQYAVNLDFNTDQTVEDVLNRINGSGIGVLAQISDDGKRIDILNRVSGTNLTVEENGGHDAELLGIRTVAATTKLSSLNLGNGIETVDGDDIRILTADGSELLFDMSAAETLDDVINVFNGGAGGAITAELSPHGNGIEITDNTAGPNTLRIEAVDHSPALYGLGLNVLATNGQLIGEDVNPVRVESAFTSLLELRESLNNNDRQAMTVAGGRIERTMSHMELVRGKLAAQAKQMADRVTRVENEEYTAKVLKSDVRDADITDAVVRFQQVQTALEANLTVATRVMNLSLLDYL